MPEPVDPAVPAARLTEVFRAEHGRVVAALARRFGDLDLAEDCVSEALVLAVEKWPVDGVPPNPGAWLTTVAGNKGLDRLRREAKRDGKHAESLMILDDTPPEPTGVIQDDRLRLVFTCCHPALAPQNRVALTLRLLGGLTVAEIARAFLVPETTMAQRITRAKAKIKQARIPFRVPGPADLPERLGTVLSSIYLVFNEGYLGSSPEADAIRDDLCAEAIRLARLTRELLPREPEVTGLLALLLLTDARRPARLDGDRIVALGDQDRTRWDRIGIAEGHALVRECLAVGRPGPFQLQAAINAVHTDAPTDAATDWSQVLALYDQWVAIAPSPVVALNRAVALAEVEGAAAALAVVDGLALVDYQPWHATRADLLRRLDRADDAREAYAEAITRATNGAERSWLEARLTTLD